LQKFALLINDVTVAGTAGSYGHSPSMLEARYSWADGTQGLPLSDATEVVEDEIRRHIEEAMTESPLKDSRKGKGLIVVVFIFLLLHLIMWSYFASVHWCSGSDVNISFDNLLLHRVVCFLILNSSTSRKCWKHFLSFL